ncbi:glycerophosphodiester phosphodiesterase [Vallitalea sediminicola]
MNLPLITAHAGCMNTQPNTISSILKGIETGADIIEVDVRATKDGVAILTPDSLVNPSELKSKKVEELTFEELRIFEETKNIVTLEEVLDLILKYDKVLNLDMKSSYCIEPMTKIVIQKNMTNHVILSGCDKEKAFYMHKNYPGFRVLLNVEDENFNSKNYNYQSIIKEICHDAIDTSCCGINIEYKHCNKELIDYAHSRFLPISIWTLDDISDMNKYFKLGVYSITTNKVKKMMELKKNILMKRRAGNA